MIYRCLSVSSMLSPITQRRSSSSSYMNFCFTNHELEAGASNLAHDLGKRHRGMSLRAVKLMISPTVFFLSFGARAGCCPHTAHNSFTVRRSVEWWQEFLRYVSRMSSRRRPRNVKFITELPSADPIVAELLATSALTLMWSTWSYVSFKFLTSTFECCPGFWSLVPFTT